MTEINKDEWELIANVMDARTNVRVIKDEIAALKLKCNQWEKAEEVAEAAYLAFMDECGMVKSECGLFETYIKESEQVDIASPDAVPNEYIREKISREPDKLKIKANAANLQGSNWFAIKKVRNLQIKMK